MSFYRIEIPSKGIDQTISITDDGLAGIAAAATSIYSDRDNTIMISDQGGRKLDLDAILDNTQSVVADGEAAFEVNATPKGKWINQVMKEIKNSGAGAGTGKITKPFTVKLGGSDGTHIVQFDHPDFFRGLVQMYRVAGLEPSEYLVNLHEGNTPLSVPQKITQFGGNKKYHQRGGKKTLSAKQLAALARGRAIRAANLAAQRGGYY